MPSATCKKGIFIIMHHKRLLLGFLLGLFTGAVYHYTHKSTPKDQDSLYKLVGKLQGKVDEARDPDSDLHATIDKVSSKAKDVADDAAAKAKDAADQAGDKVKSAVSKAQAKAEDVADDATAKVHDAADAASKSTEGKSA